MTSIETRTSPAPVEAPAMDHELHELFLDELGEMLHAEQQLTWVLPKVMKAVEAEALRAALEAHLHETNAHISRVENVFQSLGEDTRTRQCNGMKGILEDANEMIELMQGTWSLDATVIAACRKVEHFEIAAYDTLIAWAEQLGHDEAARLLKENLREGKAADEKLIKIGLSIAHQQAVQS